MTKYGPVASQAGMMDAVDPSQVSTFSALVSHPDRWAMTHAVMCGSARGYVVVTDHVLGEAAEGPGDTSRFWHSFRRRSASLMKVLSRVGDARTLAPRQNPDPDRRFPILAAGPGSPSRPAHADSGHAQAGGKPGRAQRLATETGRPRRELAACRRQPRLTALASQMRRIPPSPPTAAFISPTPWVVNMQALHDTSSAAVTRAESAIT